MIVKSVFAHAVDILLSCSFSFFSKVFHYHVPFHFYNIKLKTKFNYVKFNILYLHLITAMFRILTVFFFFFYSFFWNYLCKRNYGVVYKRYNKYSNVNIFHSYVSSIFFFFFLTLEIS